MGRKKQINNIDTSFEKSKNNLVSNSKDINIYKVFATYSINIEFFGSTFLEKQKALLNDIDEILIKECDHNWIDDVIDEPLDRSRNICYCSKCYCRKN